MGDVEVPALSRGISLTIDRLVGEFVAVMGSSGSGKSTFMNIVRVGVDRPTRGKYFLEEEEVGSLSRG